MKKILVTLSFGFLLGCGAKQNDFSLVRSLTDGDYTGKKYYFGWGAANRGDPSDMHNEVKYDVLHTHDIFTKEVGGNYIGTKEIGPQVDENIITQHWDEIGGVMGADDMYVQYSSGHGYEEGLGVGVSYDQIRDNALAYPAKEIVIFTMACHSGGLVDSFNDKKSQWQDWQSRGRTLFVMGSSETWENSSTGPGTDEDEPDGPYGSAGSAFGHSLWKALIGDGDGYGNGVQDGYLTLSEIKDFTINLTEDIGGHTPVVTGAFNGNLIMNRVPSQEFIDASYAARL
jgi:hypothetical protein